MFAPQVKVENESEVQEFHAWECISLLQRYSTLDFQIQNEENMTAFFHVVWRIVYKLKDSDFMDIFRKLKFKMKLGYECWRRGCEL